MFQLKAAYFRLFVYVGIPLWTTEMLHAQETGSLLLRMEAVLRADPGMADSLRHSYAKLIISGRDDPDDSLSAHAARLLAEAYGRSGATDVEVFFQSYAGSTAWGRAHPRFQFEREMRRAFIREQQHRYPGASGRYTDALVIADRAGDSARMVRATTGLLRVSTRLGDLSTASVYINSIVPLAIRLGDKKILADVGLATGAWQLANKSYPDAVASLSASLAYHASIRDSVCTVEGQLLMAKTQLEWARPNEALQTLMQALDWSAHSINGRVRVLIQMAELLNVLGKPIESNQYLQQADSYSFSNDPELWMEEVFPVLSYRLASEGASAAREALLLRYLSVRDQVKIRRDEAYLAAGKIISEWERLDTSNTAVRDIRRDQNRVMWVLMAFLGSSLLAVIVIFRQHHRMRAQLRTLFRKNLEEMQQAAEASVSQRILESVPSVNLEEAPVQARYQAILQLMERDKPWLDAGFSLQDLSTRLATNQKYISQAINMYSETGFSGMMNRYRVNEARRLILEGKPDVSLNDIALQAGFTNRVSFYRQFKELTGISPSEFVKLAR